MSHESTSGLLSLASRERIDRVCINFEDAWQASQSPQIADFLEGFRNEERAALLRELLLLEIDYLRQQGSEPVPEEYFARFPDDRPVVAEVFRSNPVPEPRELSQGQRIGRYSIQRKVGQGSFGTVYEAWDTELERPVAIKVPRLDRFGQSRDIDDFVEEARTAAKLDHPAIVSVLDVVRDDQGIPLIVMQYVAGRSLREQLSDVPLGRDRVVQILIQVAEGMDYAHRRGFIHRDLEPRNIILDSAGNPHITDFGLAVHESNQRARAGESAGSLAYMSPEQLRGESHWLDGRSDVWALGVIMYEMLVGRRPFSGKSFEEVASEIFVREPKPLRQIDAEIPAELEHICLRCLSKSPANRFPTAQDLAIALRQAAGFEVSETKAMGIDRGNEKVSGIGMWGRNLALAAWLVIGVAVIGLLVVSRGDTSPVARITETAVQGIELSVWTTDDRFRGRVSKTDTTASPLNQGDKVRLDVTLLNPEYLYVLWIGTDGDLTPIYPWKNGDWSDRGVESPIQNLSLPTITDQTWQVKAGEAGAETIIALVAKKPLPAEIDFSAMTRNLRPQTGTDWASPQWFDNGRLAARSEATTRAPQITRPQQIADPVMTNQLLITKQLQPFCVTVQALCFPLTESKP